MRLTQLGNKTKTNKGFFVPEILIVVAIITVALTTLLGVVNFSLGVYNLIEETTKATLIARNTIEEVRNFRDRTTWDDNGLGTLVTGVSYYPQKTTDTPPEWSLIQGTETIGKFNRQVVFGEVFRDSQDNIVESGGTQDSNTKKVTVTVSWNYKNETKSIEFVTYLTNWRN